MNNNFFPKKSRNFLEAYLNNSSPTGFESEGQKLWLKQIKPYIDEYLVDTYGTVVGIVNPNSKYKVVIEAHADEISWFVHYITKDGYIYLKRNGGSDHQIAPSKRVNIHTSNGLVKAVFGWPAIHTRTPKNEKSPKVENIFLDCGANSKSEVEKMGIHVGCVVTYEDKMMTLNEKFIVGRALDNRIGGFIISEVARLIKTNGINLPFGLYVTNSVQEEVGLHGAKMIVEKIKPNVAIVTDVCHDTNTPMIDKYQQGDIKCGMGPVLSYGPAVQNNLLKLIINSAEENKIPFQRLAASRFTGTDTDAFAFATGGVASSLISLPLKYMHTTVETADINDIQAVVELIYYSLLKIKENSDFRYFK